MNKITPADAGCWLDGSQGWHNTYRVCDRAMLYGWLTDKPEQREAVEGLSQSYAAGATSLAVTEMIAEAAKDATDYLNEIAPDGYTFIWDAGELSLMADAEAADLGYFG
jgi:hypothetical protein